MNRQWRFAGNCSLRRNMEAVLRPFGTSLMVKPMHGVFSTTRQWLRVLVVGAVLLIALYCAWQRDRGPQPEAPQAGPAGSRLSLPRSPANEIIDSPQNEVLPDDSVNSPLAIIHGQTIRDQDGRVVYRGDVNLEPTLDRIRQGHRLRYTHDGAAFENRERRLPRQPAGYYREYVHPTPRVGGPGPQRVVVGEGGEVFYTPDHYRTFRRIDQP